MKTLRTTLATALLASLAFAGSAFAQAGYPDKPITMIVPFPPGGVADTVARPVAEALARELGQTVIAENKAGAGGATGIGAAARAPADGYTILSSLSSISILPEADKILGKLGRLVDGNGYNSVDARDCSGRAYSFRAANRKGKRVTVDVNAYTGDMWR